MKALFSIFILFISINIFAQETDNFKIDNGSLIWQKIYTSALSPEAIIKQLKEIGSVRNIEFIDNLATGELEISANYKKAGFTEMSIPMYIPRNNIICTVTINFKDGRYRVTLRNLKLKATMEDPVTKLGEITDIETFALKKGNSEFKTSFLKTPGIIYTYTFNHIFDINAITNDTNW